MKRAVIYYSLTENTRAAAEKIAEATGSELIRIEMVKRMPEGRNQQIMYGGMLATFGVKPKLNKVPNNISEYDEIIIGLPVWAGKMAPPMATLLKDNEIQNKVKAAFILSGSGNSDKCEAKLKTILPELKYTASLADSYNSLSEQNDEKISDFVKNINI